MKSLAQPLHKLDSFDQGFLLMVGRVRLVTPEQHLGMTIKKMKDIRLWGPESVLLKSALVRSWRKHGAPLIKEIQAQFISTDDWYEVHGQDISDAFHNYAGIGLKVWADVKPTARDLFQMCQSRAADHFNEQRRAAKVAKIDFTESQWASYLSSSLEDHLGWFVTEYPTRQLQPAIQRLIQNVQTNPEFRTIDRGVLKDRIANLVGQPEQYLGMTGDLHMGKLWSFTGLQTARAENVTTYIVVSQWDAVTCDVCAQLSGKSFDVNRSMEVVQHYLDSDPRQDGDNMPFPRREDIDNKPPDALHYSGLIPPFHGRCRCDIVYGWSAMTVDTVAPEMPDVTPGYAFTTAMRADEAWKLVSGNDEARKFLSKLELEDRVGVLKDSTGKVAGISRTVHRIEGNSNVVMDWWVDAVDRLGTRELGEQNVLALAKQLGLEAVQADRAIIFNAELRDISVLYRSVEDMGLRFAGEMYNDLRIYGRGLDQRQLREWMNLPDFMALQRVPTKVLSPLVEDAFATEQHRQLYRAYEAEYLEFMKSLDGTGTMVFRDKVEDMYHKAMGQNFYASLKEWQFSAQDYRPMGLKVKAGQMEPGWGAKTLFKDEWRTDKISRIAEAAAKISDEAYLRARAFNQAYLMNQNIESVTLMRGTGGRTGKKIIKAILEEGSDVTEVVIKDANLAGYTPLVDKAGEFGHLEGGVTVRVEFGRQQVFVSEDLFHRITRNYEEELEWIMVGGERMVKVADMRLPDSVGFFEAHGHVSVAPATAVTPESLMEVLFGKNYGPDDIPF